MFEIYVPTIQYSWIMSQHSNQTIVTILKDEYIVSRHNACNILNKQRIQQTHLTFKCDNAVNKQIERNITKAAV